MLRHSNLQHQRAAPAAANASGSKRKAVSGRHGDIAYVSPDDPIGRAVALYGEWAQVEIDFLCGLVEPGDTVLDVGAHIGTHAIAFAKRVGATGAVHAFEPRSVAHSLLKRNLASSGASNVTARPLAVMDRAGEWVRPANGGGMRTEAGSSVLRSVGAADGEPEGAVRAIGIDELALERCNLVKIDVDGMEALVLKGMGRTIARLQPMIFCSCNSLEVGIDLLRLLPQSYRAFLVRCPAFNKANVLGTSDNIFGHACEAGLLFMPAGATQSLEAGWVRGAELIAVDSSDELGSALLATPREGDASLFERDPERSGREASSLGAVLSEQSAKLLRATHAHMRAVQRIDEARETLQAIGSAGPTPQVLADAVPDDRGDKDDEIVRLQFRAASLTACLRRLEEKLDRMEADRDRALGDAARAREEVRAARHGMEDSIRTIAGSCDRLAEALERDGKQTSSLAATCYSIAERASRTDVAMEELVHLFRAAVIDSRQQDAVEVARASKIGAMALWVHPLRKEYKQVVQSRTFDAKWYLANNSDVARSGDDPLIHYLRNGAAERRDPSPHFSTERYLQSNPDVAQAGLNPLVHYVRHGRREGRPVEPSAAARSIAS